MRNIDKIMSQNESQITEWKESWQDKYLEWICMRMQCHLLIKNKKWMA